MNMRPKAVVPDLAEVFKALSDPTRLGIFRIIRDGGCCPDEGGTGGLSELAGRFGVSLSTVSHHVKELRRAGLIRCEKRGQTVACRAVPEALELIHRFSA